MGKTGSATTPIDAAWLRAHPLPRHGEGTDKNSRGRVLVVGGSRMVPGGLRLTAEAALRAGAGKVQLATVEGCALMLGMAVPEAGVIALPEAGDGEIDARGAERLAEAVADCDTLLVGPAMTGKARAGALLDALLDAGSLPGCVVLDAAAIPAARERAERLRALPGHLVITANDGEMAALLGRELDAVDADPESAVSEAAARFGAVVLLKRGDTLVSAPGGQMLCYSGGGAGLATGGSGDVLAGLIAALIARGQEPLSAAAWGVWLHGEAGRGLAGSVGPIGFLARELTALVPRLLAEGS